MSTTSDISDDDNYKDGGRALQGRVRVEHAEEPEGESSLSILMQV